MQKVPSYMSQIECSTILASSLVLATCSSMTGEDTLKILPHELFFASHEELRMMFSLLLVYVSAWMRMERLLGNK